MHNNSGLPMQLGAWPYRPGQYLHGPKPKEKVVTNTVLAKMAAALADKLTGNAFSYREHKS